LKKVKHITGVPVAEVKTNHFVMARMREPIFNQRRLPLKKLKQFIYVAVKKPATNLFVMEAIPNKSTSRICSVIFGVNSALFILNI